MGAVAVLQVGNTIDDNTFAELYSGYQMEQHEIAAKLAAHESRISEIRDKEAGARRFAETTSKYIGAEELTRDMRQINVTLPKRKRQGENN